MVNASEINSLLAHYNKVDKLFYDVGVDALNYSKCAVITDQAVQVHYHWDLPTIVIPQGEQAKTCDTAMKVWHQLIEQGFDRKSLLIACGGGAICDATGFIASCFMRGIDTFYIPTTVMAMVDASIGGKTALNMDGRKNVIGTFHQPKKVFICSEFLNTLSEREVASGIAEMIKMGVVWNPMLFEALEKESSLAELIEWAAQSKIEIVSQDVHDQGLRSILNWGHTVGHALEGLTGYSRWLHGEAVAIGMSCAAFISWKLGYADQTFYERQNRLIQKYKLPTILPDDIDMDALLALMEQDKKAVRGKIRLILARQIGTVLSVPDLDNDILREALEAKRSSDR